MAKDEIMQLCDTIRETSFSIHKYLRQGHLEKIYENALLHRLRNQHLEVEPQHTLTVHDEDDFVLGELRVDLFVKKSLIIEIKACKTIADEHTAQLLGYLRASRVEHGLLINFGAPKLQIRKYILSDT